MAKVKKEKKEKKEKKDLFTINSFGQIIHNYDINDIISKIDELPKPNPKPSN